MGEGVIALADTERAAFEVAADFKRGDAGGIGLEGERDEIVEDGEIGNEIGVFRFVDVGFRFWDVGPLFAESDLFLHVTKRGEILVEFFAVAVAELAGERFGVAVNGIKDRCLEIELIGAAGDVGGIVRSEEFAEEFVGRGDRRDACAAARPTHHAAAVEAVLGSDGEGGKAGGAPNGFSGALIDADVALGHRFGVHATDAAEEGVDGEVAALETVV